MKLPSLALIAGLLLAELGGAVRADPPVDVEPPSAPAREPAAPPAPAKPGASPLFAPAPAAPAAPTRQRRQGHGRRLRHRRGHSSPSNG
jgi:hypothetical protein